MTVTKRKHRSERCCWLIVVIYTYAPLPQAWVDSRTWHRICVNDKSLFLVSCHLDTGPGGAARASESRPNRDWDLDKLFIWCSVNFFFRISWVGAPWPGLELVLKSENKIIQFFYRPNIFALESSFSSSRSRNKISSSSFFFFSHNILKKHFILF